MYSVRYCRGCRTVGLSGCRVLSVTDMSNTMCYKVMQILDFYSEAPRGPQTAVGSAYDSYDRA